MDARVLETVTRRVAAWPRRLTSGGVVVGVSGGVDSGVLLELLVGMAARFSWPLTVAHAEHGLRGAASVADAAAVHRRAAALGLPCVIRRLDVRGETERAAGSLEMTARRLRHGFLAEVARERGARAVVLGHHGDDQVELFLLRLFRGAGGLGLGGLQEVAPSPADSRLTLLRPLLGIHKQELREFAREQGWKFREDASNRDRAIPRNQVRHAILPWLRRQLGPHLDEAILRTSELVRDDAEWVRAQAAKWQRNPRRGEFRGLPVALQRAVLREQLWEQNVPVDFALIERLRLAESAQSAPAGRTLRRTPRGVLQVVSPTPAFNPGRESLELGPKGTAHFSGVSLRWNSRARPARRTKPGVEYFDAGAVGPRAILRHWQPGDRFQPLGFTRPTKLQNVFTNRKIPAADRRQRLVATTAGGVIFWVEGLPPGELFKFQPAGRPRLEWRWQRV